MKPFSIFRAGKHTAMSGVSLDFTSAMLRDAVAAYDPAKHEAPMVVGHPKQDAPAYGWAKALTFNEETGEVMFDPSQVDADFSDMVANGRFKKRSASWYLPDSPNNPTPGKLYLKHVGFLGAAAPAVKGLKEVSFKEDDALVVEFADRYTWGTMASLMRNLREWFIAEKDMELADRLVPAYSISELERASNQPDNNPFPSYIEDTTMLTPAEIAALQAQVTTLTATNATLLTQVAAVADFAEAQTTLAARETAVTAREVSVARNAVEERVGKMIKAGKVLPAQKTTIVDFAMGLADAAGTIDFTEADKSVKKITQRDAYLRQLEAAPKVVDYTELSAPDGSLPADDTADPQKIADRAKELVSIAQAKVEKGEGRAVSFTEAVALATAEFTQAA